jgi:hypothetical protein
MSARSSFHWVYGACKAYNLAEIIYLSPLFKIPGECCVSATVRFLRSNTVRWVGRFPEAENVTQKVSRARAARAPPGPEKPRFWACQKVVPPPCKNVQKMGFLGEKACIFGQFVHNFAQKWPLFCGHSPPLQGCQSVGKKPANLYSTKCRIFGPRTPPPVAPWWDTSSRRPPTGSRRPFSKNPKNRVFEKTMMGVGNLLQHFFIIY